MSPVQTITAAPTVLESAESQAKTFEPMETKLSGAPPNDHIVPVVPTRAVSKRKPCWKIVVRVGGFVLLAAAAFWHFAVTPRWAKRIPPGWNWRSSFVGIQSFADPQSGKLPEKDPPGIYNKNVEIVPGTLKPDSVELLDSYTIYDIASGAVTWQYLIQARVDPRTGQHLKPEFKDDYFLFPRNVQKQTYHLRFSYVKGVPLSFEREENLFGLDTYVFGYKGYGEYTESYAGTKEYAGVKVEPGQEIRCADDQFVLKMWVEPLTGETVKVEESCYSNDYLVDVASGRRLAVIDKWGGIVTGKDVLASVERVQTLRRNYLLSTRYVPAAFLSSSLLLIGVAVFLGKRGNQ